MTEYERRVELSIDHIFRLQGRSYEPLKDKAIDDIRDAVLIGMTGKSPHDAVADRTLSTTSGEEAVASGICSYGDPGTWVCLVKVWHPEEKWFRSTKALEVPGGVVLQVSTREHSGHVAEALTFIPDVEIAHSSHTPKLVARGSEKQE